MAIRFQALGSKAAGLGNLPPRDRVVLITLPGSFDRGNDLLSRNERAPAVRNTTEGGRSHKKLSRAKGFGANAVEHQQRVRPIRAAE